MFSFFKKKPKENTWHPFLHELHLYCDREDHLNVNCSLYDDEIEIITASYPYYYDIDMYQEELQTLGYNNFYEVLDILFEKTKINKIDIEHVVKEEEQFNFWRIKIPMGFDENWTYRYIYVFFVTEETNRLSYRISYYDAEYESLASIANKTVFFEGVLKDPLEDEKEFVQHFLTAVVALAEQINKVIPTDLKALFPESILEKPSGSPLSEKSDTWYNFLSELCNYCNEQNDHIKIDCSKYDDTIEMITMNYPFYYQTDVYEEELKTLGYNNFYEVLDIFYHRKIDIKKAIEEEEQFYFWKIRIPLHFDQKWTCIYFYTVLVIEDESNKDSYRIHYYHSECETLQSLAENTSIIMGDLKNPLEHEKEIVQHFLTASVALAQQVNIEIPKDLKAMFPVSLLETPPSKEDFIQLIELVNYHPFDEDIDEVATGLYEDLMAELPKISGEYSFWNHTETLYYNHFKVLNFENAWSSDWKFNPEDPKYFIRDILGKEWPFEYPEETYSDNLFPYIQEGLGKIGLALMGLATYGDYYEFFLVKKEDVAKILKLSKKLYLEIDYYE